MRPFLAFALLCCTVFAADEPSIYSYRFEWKVSIISKASLKIVKTADAPAFVECFDGVSTLKLSREEASEIGEAYLPLLNITLTASKGGESDATVATESHVVGLHTGSDGDFMFIRAKGDIGPGYGLKLDKASATRIFCRFVTAPALCREVDEKVGSFDNRDPFTLEFTEPFNPPASSPAIPTKSSSAVLMPTK